MFQELGITQVHAPCGGNGTCKKCLVTVEGLGKVLSCQTQCKDDMCVTVAEEQKSAIAENGNCYLYPADAGEGLLAACDIGTTTVVCHLLDGATGVRLCTVSAPNAQRSFGADVISRIQASVDSGLDKLQSAIVDQINGMLVQLKQKAGRTEDIRRLAVAGNTVMSHLFCGLSPESIGVAPFTPLSLFGESYDAKQIGIEGCETVYVVPSIAGYVGGDIVADLAAVQMHSSVLAEDGEKETLMLILVPTERWCLENPVRMCAVRQRQDRLLKERRSPWECRQLPELSQKSGWKMEKSVVPRSTMHRQWESAVPG